MLEWDYSIALDTLFKIRGERTPTREALIIDVGTNARGTITPSEFQDRSDVNCSDLTAPARPDVVNRCTLARIVHSLASQKPQAIVINLAFEQPTDKPSDRALSKAIAEAGNVIILQRVSTFVDPQLNMVRHSATPLLPEIENAAIDTAPFPLPKNNESVRQFWTQFDQLGGKETLPVKAYLMSRAEAENEKSVSQDNETRFTRSRIYNFFGPPGSIPTVHYTDYLSNPSHLTTDGKVVFIGYAQNQLVQKINGVKTVFTTPDGRDISGVELAATAFLNLLKDDYIRPVDWAARFVLYGSIIFLIIFALNLRSTSTTILLAVSAILAVACISVFSFTKLSLLQPAMSSIVLLGAGFGTVLTLQSIYNWHQWKVAFQRLSLYAFPKHIEGDLSEGPFLPKQEAVNGICLTCDFIGYSDVANQLSPDELAQHMNKLFSSVFSIVREYGGTIVDPGDDSFFVIWNHTEPKHINAQRAANLADKIVHELSMKDGMLQLKPSIALVEGQFAIGACGAGDSFATNLTGQIINLSTRLEKVNRLTKTSVLMTEGFASLLDREDILYVGNVSLKGQAGFVKTYTPLSARHSETEAQLSAFKQCFEYAVACFEADDVAKAQKLFLEASSMRPGFGPSVFYQTALSAQQEIEPHAAQGVPSPHASADI